MKKLILLIILIGTFPANAEEGCPQGLFQSAQGCVPRNGGGYASSASAPPVRWHRQWGAVAQDQVRRHLGTSAHMDRKRDAQKAALSDCEMKGGETCVIELTYFNSCVVVAWGDNAGTFLTNHPIELAIEEAMAECEDRTENCKIYYDDCSYPIREW